MTTTFKFDGIKIFVIDGEICYLEQLVVDIIRAIKNNVIPLRLSVGGEGPCLENIGFYKLLDQIFEKFPYPTESVIIETANLIEEHPTYQIIRKHQSYEYDAIKKHTVTVGNTEKKFDSNFKHFGHFIGHGNQYRLQLGSYLYSNHKNQTLQTYHCQVTEEYHRPHIGLEDMMFCRASPQEIDWAVHLLKNTPLSIDAIDSYPILVPANLNITKVYPTFFVEIVCQTYFSGKVFYVDEKIWRPMLMKTPFMIQGSADTIKNLHKLGFKTFDQWWPEGYSLDPWDCQVPYIIDNIKSLSKLSIAELDTMYQEMLPVLNHNYNKLLELTPWDFQVFGQPQ